MVSIQHSKPSSASHMPQAVLKGVEKNAAPPLAVFRVENRRKLGPGALVRVRNEAAEAAEAAADRDVYFLVTHSDLLPSNGRSSLQCVNLHAPSGAALRGIPPEWVIYVLVDAPRRTTLMQLTQQAVNAMLATGVTCRAVASTAAEGMRATHVWGSNALTVRPVQIVRVAGETIKLNREVNVGENGLLVGEDGSLMAVADLYDTHYSLAEIVKDFLKERVWQIRWRSLALATRTMISILFILVEFNS